VIAAAVAQLMVLGSPERGLYGRFAADNPAVIELTSARVAGYWDLYYSGGFRSCLTAGSYRPVIGCLLGQSVGWRRS
jgi:hypothetical protein